MKKLRADSFMVMLSTIHFRIICLFFFCLRTGNELNIENSDYICSSVCAWNFVSYIKGKIYIESICEQVVE
jgi:hypothetical protein